MMGSIRFRFAPIPHSGVTPAIFLDRDGVINEQVSGGYVTQWSQFRFVPGIERLIAGLTELGLPLIVVSNQAGIEKGFIPYTALNDITYRFVASLRSYGARIHAVYYCPHSARRECSCRKPRPGLLERAARDWHLDLNSSVLIGDSPSDAEAARAAGCRAILVPRTTTECRKSFRGSTGLGRIHPVTSHVDEWLRFRHFS